MSLVNKAVQRVVAIYRSGDSKPLELNGSTTTTPNQAFADVHVEFDGNEEVFLLIPIGQVPKLIRDLDDCVFKHNMARKGMSHSLWWRRG